MTRDAISRWLNSNLLHLLGLLVAGMIAWANLNAAVNQKVDKSEFQQVISEIRELRRDMKAQWTLACRDHPKDSACPTR